MNARATERATLVLRRKRRRTVESAALAAASAALALVAALFSLALAAALGIGAAFELGLAVLAFLGRRELIGRLALQPDAYVLPEVKRYGCRLVRPRERERLARGIMSALDEAQSSQPHSLLLPERLVTYASELEALARELLSPAAHVQPTSAVACLRLLTRGVESPLYNPNLPPEDLGSILYRIRAGIRAG